MGDSLLAQAALNGHAVPHLLRRFKQFAKLAGVCCLAIACSALSGWMFDAASPIWPDKDSMRAAVALAFILGSASLLLQLTIHGARVRRLALACAAAASLIGVFGIVEHVFPWYSGWFDSGLDRLEPVAAQLLRMPVLSALGLVLMGLSLMLSLDVASRRRPMQSQALAVAQIFLALLPILAGSFGATGAFLIERWSLIGPWSSAAMLTSGLAILAASADRGFMVLMTRSSIAGSLIRHVMPLAFLVPFAISAMRVVGEEVGLYEEWFGVALSTWIKTMLIVSGVWWYAVGVDRHEKAQRFEQQRFRDLLESTPDPIVIVDEAGIVRHVNLQAERVFGYARDEIEGQTVELLAPEELRSAHSAYRSRYAHVADLREVGKNRELRVRGKDGSLFTVEVNLNPIPVENGIWTIAAVRDVSERKRAEAALRNAQALAQSTLDALSAPVCVVSGAGTIVACNRAWTESGTANGCESAEIGLGLHYLDVCGRVCGPDGEQADALAIAMRAVLTRQSETYSIRYPCHASINLRWFVVHVTRYEVDEQVRLVLAHEDVTQAHLQESKILRLNRVYAVLSGINALIVRATTRRELFEQCCRIAVEHGGFGVAWIDGLDAVTQELHPLAHAGDDAATILQNGRSVNLSLQENRGLIAQVIASNQRACRNNLSRVDEFSTQRLRTATALGYRSAVTLPLTLKGVVTATLSLLSVEENYFDEAELRLLDELAADISLALDSIAKQERLEHLEFHDALTGLPNASLFMDRLRQQIRNADPRRGHVAVVLIDLEHFTWINESLGRGVGDKIMREIGASLNGRLPSNSIVGRVGGDTFAVAGACENVTASEILPHVLAIFDKPFVIDGKQLRVSAQFGVALFPGDGPDAENVFENAESALMRAKSTHGRLLYFAREANTVASQRMALAADLRTAVESSQFVLHYQPKIDLANGELVGAEALIRWQHPDRGLVLPGDFIEIAEENGLIVPIGVWVIETVCAQMAAWRAAGLQVVPIMINVSPIQFTQSDLLASLQAALARHGVQARDIELELTETAAAQDVAATAETLRALGKLGVRISLDDFGTGYASLEQIRKFPVDSVKIDRQFTVDMTTSAENEAIVSAIIAMGHALNLNVIAEGVETEAQLKFLRTRGCDAMQGFYFSPAVPGVELAAMLRSRIRMNLPELRADDQPTVLVVDDEPGVRSALTRVLRREGYRILTASSGEMALEMLGVNAVQVVISDQRMPGMHGIELLDAVKRIHPNAVRMILSGYTDLDTVTSAVNRGAVFKFLTKPWDDEELRHHVREAVRHYRSAS